MGFWSSIGSAVSSSIASSDDKAVADSEKFEKYDEMLKEIQDFDLEPSKTNGSHEVIDSESITHTARKKQP